MFFGPVWQNFTSTFPLKYHHTLIIKATYMAYYVVKIRKRKIPFFLHEKKRFCDLKSKEKERKKCFSARAILTSKGERRSQRSSTTVCFQNVGKEALRQMHKLNAGWIDLRDPDDHRALTLHTRETNHHWAIEGSLLKETTLTASNSTPNPFLNQPLLTLLGEQNNYWRLYNVSHKSRFYQISNMSRTDQPLITQILSMFSHFPTNKH